MMKRGGGKGQITIFLIVGILLVSIIAFVFYFGAINSGKQEEGNRRKPAEPTRPCAATAKVDDRLVHNSTSGPAVTSLPAHRFGAIKQRSHLADEAAARGCAIAVDQKRTLMPAEKPGPSANR